MPGPLEPLAQSVSIVDKEGRPNPGFTEWLRKTVEAQVTDILGVQQTAETALAVGTAAQADASIAIADAAAAQADTDALAATVAAIVVPPSTTRSVSSNTALAPDDVTVLVDATSGAITITLSNANGYSVPVVITKTDGTANPVNMVPSGGDTLNGGPGPASLSAPNSSKTFTSDGVSQWFG